MRCNSCPWNLAMLFHRSTHYTFDKLFEEGRPRQQRRWSAAGFTRSTTAPALFCHTPAPRRSIGKILVSILNRFSLSWPSNLRSHQRVFLDLCSVFDYHCCSLLKIGFWYSIYGSLCSLRRINFRLFHHPAELQ